MPGDWPISHCRCPSIRSLPTSWKHPADRRAVTGSPGRVPRAAALSGQAAPATSSTIFWTNRTRPSKPASGRRRRTRTDRSRPAVSAVTAAGSHSAVPQHARSVRRSWQMLVGQRRINPSTGRDPPVVADDRCPGRVPHHTTMIDDQESSMSYCQPPGTSSLAHRYVLAGQVRPNAVLRHGYVAQANVARQVVRQLRGELHLLRDLRLPELL